MSTGEKESNDSMPERPFFNELLIELREMRKQNDLLRCQLEEARTVISSLQKEQNA
jgi:hypothetical protein